MKNLHTKLNVLLKVIKITKRKLKRNQISTQDARYINQVINRYLDYCGEAM